MIIRLFNLKIWKTRVNRNCENKTISKKNFNFKTSQKLNFFFVPNEALETNWMNNFYKFCYPIESVESNACWDFNLNRTFSFNFSTPLSLSLSPYSGTGGRLRGLSGQQGEPRHALRSRPGCVQPLRLLSLRAALVQGHLLWSALREWKDSLAFDIYWSTYTISCLFFSTVL